MTRTLAILVLFFLGKWAHGEEPLVSSLPTRIGHSFVPELRVRESIESGQRRLALIVSLVSIEGTNGLFNPLGLPHLGRPYRIVLVDSQGTIRHTVVRGSPPQVTPIDRKDWTWMSRGGLAGRCFWESRSTTLDDRTSDDLADLPVVEAGRYTLILLVAKRIIDIPPHPRLPQEEQQKWRDRWNDPSQDEPCFASIPVVVDVDANGTYLPLCREGENLQFDQMEVNPTLDPHGRLSLVVRLVNPSEAWLMAPTMNLFDPRRNPMHTSIVREDGQAFSRFPTSRRSSSQLYEPLASHGLLVPRDGVIGGTNSYATVLKIPGRYVVAAEIDESIYKEKLIVDGRTVRRDPSEWKTVFRSRTTTITVPEQAP